MQYPGEIVISSSKHQQRQLKQFKHPPRNNEVELDRHGGTFEQIVFVYPVVAEKYDNNSWDANRIDV